MHALESSSKRSLIYRSMGELVDRFVAQLTSPYLCVKTQHEGQLAQLTPRLIVKLVGVPHVRQGVVGQSLE